MANIALQVLGQYRRNCTRRKIKLKLTVADFEELIFKDCFYCGAKPSNRLAPHGKFIAVYQGIDRKDNSRGYEKDNVVPCCHFCNNIKGDKLSHSEMKAIAIALKAFRRLQEAPQLALRLQARLRSTLKRRAKTRQ